MSEPIDIEYDTQRQRLSIEWDDGARSLLPMAYVRGWCPCAMCQGHGNVVRFQPQPGATAAAVEEVGAYALGIRFADGHDTGIYTWKWLRTISAEGEPAGYKYGRFVAGAYEADPEDGPGDAADEPLPH